MTTKNPVGYPKGRPWSEERKQRFIESGQRDRITEILCEVAKNKTPEQRAKMRKAKLGVAKSEEHKANMSESHKQRWVYYRDLEATMPDAEPSELWAILKEMRLNKTGYYKE